MVKKIDLSVLFVEDEELILECMGAHLGRRFRDLYMATDGCDGFDKFCEFSPDIVIADIETPCMSGLDMCGKIRELKSDIPIIITTAFSEQELVKKIEMLEVEAYLLKPIDFEEMDNILFELANRLLKKRA